MNFYEILVPCVRNNGVPFRTRFHRVWDAKVREITGGLTVLPPVRGQWVAPTGELFAERMIPVRIAATPEQMDAIADMTAAYYEQKAILYYIVSTSVVVKHYDTPNARPHKVAGPPEQAQAESLESQAAAT